MKLGSSNVAVTRQVPIAIAPGTIPLFQQLAEQAVLDRLAVATARTDPWTAARNLFGGR